jgi:clathrin heavy chain
VFEKVIKAAEKAHLWPELVFLYIKYDEFVGVYVFLKDIAAQVFTQDNAALAMIERSSDAWEHNSFKDVVVRVANIEMYVLTLHEINVCLSDETPADITRL